MIIKLYLMIRKGLTEACNDKKKYKNITILFIGKPKRYSLTSHFL